MFTICTLQILASTLQILSIPILPQSVKTPSAYSSAAHEAWLKWSVTGPGSKPFWSGAIILSYSMAMF